MGRCEEMVIRRRGEREEIKKCKRSRKWDRICIERRERRWRGEGEKRREARKGKVDEEEGMD